MKLHSLAIPLLIAFGSGSLLSAQCQVPNAGLALPEGPVVYTIDPNLPPGVQMAIQQAIQTWDAALPNHTFTTSGYPTVHFELDQSFSGSACAGTLKFGNAATGELANATTSFPPSSANYNYQQALKTASHEIGHMLGLQHPTNCTEGQTVMTPTPSGQCLRSTFPPDFMNLPSQQDMTKAISRTSDVTYASQQHRTDEDACNYDYGNWDPYTCTCDFDNRSGLPGSGSPILVSLGNSRFELTDVAGGVPFDIDGNGELDQLAWTPVNPEDAFLVLDRNFNRAIDSGVELFGNYTPQPPSSERNGFLALAMLESPAMRGVPDNQITPDDAVFEQLKLWFDANHDGVAQSIELSSLSSHGIVAIDLNYHRANRRDKYGNEFRYSSLVHFSDGRTSKAVDVFLVLQ